MQNSASINVMTHCGFIRDVLSLCISGAAGLPEERGDLPEHTGIGFGDSVEERVIREAGRRAQRIRQQGGRLCQFLQTQRGGDALERMRSQKRALCVAAFPGCRQRRVGGIRGIFSRNVSIMRSDGILRRISS